MPAACFIDVGATFEASADIEETMEPLAGPSMTQFADVASSTVRCGAITGLVPDGIVAAIGVNDLGLPK